MVQKIFSELSTQLKIDVVGAAYGDVISKIDLFRNMSMVFFFFSFLRFVLPNIDCSLYIFNFPQIQKKKPFVIAIISYMKPFFAIPGDIIAQEDEVSFFLYFKYILNCNSIFLKTRGEQIMT